MVSETIVVRKKSRKKTKMLKKKNNNDIEFDLARQKQTAAYVHKLRGRHPRFSYFKFVPTRPVWQFARTHLSLSV